MSITSFYNYYKRIVLYYNEFNFVPYLGKIMVYIIGIYNYYCYTLMSLILSLR